MPHYWIKAWTSLLFHVSEAFRDKKSFSGFHKKHLSGSITTVDMICNMSWQCVYVCVCVSAGQDLWSGWRRCVHVVLWKQISPVQFGGVRGPTLHDATQLHRVHHFEWTQEWVLSALSLNTKHPLEEGRKELYRYIDYWWLGLKQFVN